MGINIDRSCTTCRVTGGLLALALDHPGCSSHHGQIIEKREREDARLLQRFLGGHCSFLSASLRERHPAAMSSTRRRVPGPRNNSWSVSVVTPSNADWRHFGRLAGFTHPKRELQVPRAGPFARLRSRTEHVTQRRPSLLRLSER